MFPCIVTKCADHMAECSRAHGSDRVNKRIPGGIMFVDGTRQPVFKSSDDDMQNDQYFGKDKIHCYAVLIYVDIYGLIRRIEVSYSGRLHDKTK